ncbi:MAG: hypothetical protein JWP03_5401 [Phycisphaerales bacterium]|nr:hypothetical protein [Phycisphaerales bacterium]
MVGEYTHPTWLPGASDRGRVAIRRTKTTEATKGTEKKFNSKTFARSSPSLCPLWPLWSLCQVLKPGHFMRHPVVGEYTTLLGFMPRTTAIPRISWRSLHPLHLGAYPLDVKHKHITPSAPAHRAAVRAARRRYSADRSRRTSASRSRRSACRCGNPPARGRRTRATACPA